jgi:SAM-dependent methyltransferase
MAEQTSAALDEGKLHDFLGQMLGDLGGAFSVGLVRMGEQLGLYKALNEKGAMTSQELATETRTAERYIREWLSHQAASNYLSYDEATGKFALPPEQAAVFANEDSPVYMLGAFDAAVAALDSASHVQNAFHTGEGLGWGDHSECLFCSTAKFFRPGYQAHILQDWLPELDGVVGKLEAGGRAADVGCGHGISTAIMAEAFPKSEFCGFDFHDGSIEHANDLAKSKGLANLKFETAMAKNYPGKDYDLVCLFDCLHDMGDPEGAARYIRGTLKDDGALMIVEPMAGDTLQDNLNPVGRLYYAASTVICVPTSLAQEVGLALGAQAGEARITEVLKAAGFSSVRRATETPFNMVLEARP